MMTTINTTPITPPAPAKIILPLVRRHAEDAAFYWMQHTTNSYSPLLSFERLRHFDRVLNSHLDGLRIAGSEAWDLALDNLKRWRTGGESFVAGILALEGDDITRFETVWRIVDGDHERMLTGFVSAFGWIKTQAKAQAWIARLLNDAQHPAKQMVALRALAIRGDMPSVSLLPFLSSEHIDQRVAAAMLVGRMRMPAYQAQLHTLLQDPQLEVRNAAATALYMSGKLAAATAPMQQGLIQLNLQAETQRGLAQQKTQARALKLARQLGHALPLGYTGISELTQTLPPRQMLTLLAHHGDPAQIPWLITQMQDPALAKLAAWAINMLTGLDIEAQGMQQAAPQEKAQDERTRPMSDPDVGLPWPDPVAVQAWWKKHQASFSQQEKLLLGKPCTDVQHCLDVLRHASQAARYAAAQALAIYHPQYPVFEVCSDGWQQLRQLDSLQEVMAVHDLIDDFNTRIEEFDEEDGTDTLATKQLVLHEKFSAEQIQLLESKIDCPFPDALKNMYIIAGRIGHQSDEEEFNSLQIDDFNYLNKYHFGLINAIKQRWGGRPEFDDPKKHAYCTKEKQAYLNEEYFVFGCRQIDDNAATYLYFDRAGQFGALEFDQDSQREFGLALANLSNKSAAYMSLSELISDQLDAIVDAHY